MVAATLSTRATFTTPLILFLLVSSFLVGCGSGSTTSTSPSAAVIDASLLASGRILFAAHNSTDPDGALNLFVVKADGTGLKALTTATGFPAPDIEAKTGGTWRIAFGDNGVSVFDCDVGKVTLISSVAGGTRADFDTGAKNIVFQGGGRSGINIFKAAADGTGTITQLTNISSSVNDEWPYFQPAGTTIVYFTSDPATRPRHRMKSDGTSDEAIEAPGGNTISHMGFSPDGTEFVDAQTLTSYHVADGTLGSLNDLKHKTTMMTQLATLGYSEVSTSEVAGQGNRGTFALSADWSRDGSKIVFDSLVKNTSTGKVDGIAIFVYTIATDTLTKVFGPDPFTGSRTNNFNYSIYTPKWVP